MMFPMLFGMIAATLFGLVSYHTYGLEGLLHSPWINAVFWSLILTGGVVSLLDECNRCLPCRLQKIFTRNHMLDTLCAHKPCGEMH